MEAFMTTLQAYYNGSSIQTVDDYKFEKNQRLIITVLDNDADTKKAGLKAVRGSLSKYANPDLIKKENGAWEKAAKEKYDLR